MADDMQARLQIADLRSQVYLLQTRSLAHQTLIAALLSTLTRSRPLAGVAAASFEKAIESAMSTAECAKEGMPAHLTVGVAAELEKWRDQLASHELPPDPEPQPEPDRESIARAPAIEERP